MTSTPLNPDERDLLDFADAVVAGKNPQPMNDMERTYLHVQNAMQGESGAIPAELKQSTWEDVMSTLAIAPEAPVSNRTRRQQSPASSRRTPARRRMQWTPMASVAAAVLVVLASIGIYVAATYESPTPPPSAPRQVAGIAPVPGETLQLATPEEMYACDFAEDMPIISATEQLPIEGTYLVWQTGGDLILRCDEEPEDIVIASGINQAGPVENIPGMVTVYQLEEGSTDFADGTSTYINVSTGQSFTTSNVYNENPGFTQFSFGEHQAGPFLFVNDEDGFLVVLDTRTMTSTPIGELFGEGSPKSFNLIAAMSEDESKLAIMLGDQDAANSGASSMPALRASDTGAEGDILLLNTHSGETSWHTLPTVEAEVITGISLSPDASRIAVTVAPQGDASRMTTDARIMMVDTEDGSVVTETRSFKAFDLVSIWTDRGLVLQAGKEILLIPANGDELSVLYAQEDSATTISRMMPTLDPNVIVAQSVYCEGECRLAEANVGVVSINVETGESERYLGQNVAVMTWAEKANLLLMVDPSVVAPDTTTYTVIDPVSGEVVAEFDGIPGIGLVERQMPLIGAKSIGISADGQTLVVSIGMKYMIELKSDGTEHSARLLPVPERWSAADSGNPTASIFLSPDGTTLSAMSQNDEARTRYLLDLADPLSEWITIESNSAENGGYILFVEGMPGD